MTADELSDIRMQCLQLASIAVGDDMPFTLVLEAAQRYYDWVIGKRADLKVVKKDE